MKKILLIAAVATLTLSLNSVVSAGDIEKAERYTVPLEQNIVEMNVNAVETGQEIALSELGFGLGSNAEIMELGASTDGIKKVTYRRGGSIKFINYYWSNWHKRISWYPKGRCYQVKDC